MERKRSQKESQNFHKKFPKRMKIKLVGVFTAIVLAFVFLAGKAVALNLVKGEEYQKQVMSQMRSGSQIIHFKRGDILDTNDTVLATSERSYNVILDVAGLLETKTSYQNKKINATVEALVKGFDLDESDLREILQDESDSRYVILKKDVDYETGKDFQTKMDKSKNIVSVTLEDSYTRTYPYGTMASDVIGFTSSGNSGTIGLEAYYNNELNGTDGKKTGYLSSGSSSENVVKSPTDGNSIVTTIDANLQAIVEKHILELNERLRDNYREGEGTKNTAVIIMDPNTGAILAEASYPNFDLNQPRDLSKYYTTEEQEAMTEEERLETLNALWRNFCVSDTFEPGSTMKPFTMAAGFETGKLTGDETYVCGGSYSYEGVAQPVSCIATDGHGTETLKQVLENSCNVGMMHIADTLGAEDFCRYQHIFGFESTQVLICLERGIHPIFCTRLRTCSPSIWEPTLLDRILMCR